MAATIKIPTPIIRARPRNEAVFASFCEAGVAPWLADLLGKRLDHQVAPESCFSPTLTKLADPVGIPDMVKAVARIVQAIVNREKIIFAVDHDLDGQASAAVLWTAFVDHFQVDPALLGVVTSHRLTEGYGVTAAVADRLIAADATLIITADQGSSDEPRLKRIKAAGKEVIVTDHHLLPLEGPPPSAYAVVNPVRRESTYDSCICGAGVAFLTMAKVRTALLSQGVQARIPSMAQLSDYVALATIGDCVATRPDLSYTNRALVRHGLALLNQGQRPCWRVIKEKLNGRISAELVGFQIAPVVAAAGRLDWAEPGFRFLVAPDYRQAKELWLTLQSKNEIRKGLERQLTARAVEGALANQHHAIVQYFSDGHCGVHGITASRLVDLFGKPAAIFAPKGAGALPDSCPASTDGQGRPLAAGSFRGVPGINIRNALQAVADRHQELLVAFGGHAAAAGATIAVEDFPQFAQAFTDEIGRQQASNGSKPAGPIVWVDGKLPLAQLSLETVDTLLTLEPWGRDFPAPLFRDHFTVASQKVMGDGSHLRLQLVKEGRSFPAVWFNALLPQGPLPCAPGEEALFVFQLQDNLFRGQRTLQLQIVCRIAAP